MTLKIIKIMHFSTKNISDTIARVTGEAPSLLRPCSLGLSCPPGCKSSSHQHAINLYYDTIIASLRTSNKCTIPRIPHAALRPFWNNELDDLKDKAIFWHNLWKSASSPAAACYIKLKLAVN